MDDIPPGNGDDPKSVLILIARPSTSSSSRVGVADAHLSKAASRVVNTALEKVVEECKKACTELAGQLVVPEDGSLPARFSPLELSRDDLGSSTQILLPVHPFPSESVYRLPASPSFAREHTMQYDSKLDGGLEIHREDGLLIVTDMDADDGSTGTGGEPGSGNQQDLTGLEADFPTLIDQVAASVARAAQDGLGFPSYDSIQDIVKKFTDLAKSACGLSVVMNCRLERCREEFGGQSGTYGSGPASTGSQKKTLPPEVKERIVRTLSEVRAQLDLIKTQLKEKGAWNPD